MSLRHDVTSRVRENLGPLSWVPGERAVWKVRGCQINLRSASRKSGDKFWFDVTPRFVERDGVDFLLYACGSADAIYVFPARDLAEIIKGASLGGQKQVPNFTIYLDDHQLEPAGRSGSRVDISRYFNAFALVAPRKAA